jgi:hypothetical protein
VPTPDDVAFQVFCLKSSSHCPNQPASSDKHVGYPLCLPVGCEGSGSPFGQQADGRSGPK